MKALSQRHRVWFCDVWGVVHNGYQPFPRAVDALIKHRKAGGIVVLLTNSPRSSVGVEHQLDEIEVDREAWDAVVTSGDVTRTLMMEQSNGKLYHIGPSRDLSLFEGLPVERVDLADANAIICTGLVHELEEKPEDYRWLAATARDRNLPFICANPDKVVRKGDALIYCAGAVADVYASLGGTVLMAGKPYAPIYQLAERKAWDIAGRTLGRLDVLAIGDGPDTDIKGASDFGIAVVLISSGINHGGAGLEAEVRAKFPLARIVGSMADLAWVE